MGLVDDVNVITTSGNLTRDAELKYAGSGVAILEIPVAINGSKKQGDEWVQTTSFVDCTMFGRRAEGIAPYLTKGTKVFISGRIEQQRWEKEGQKRSKIAVIVDNIVMAPRGDSGGNHSKPPARSGFHDTPPRSQSPAPSGVPEGWDKPTAPLDDFGPDDNPFG